MQKEGVKLSDSVTFYGSVNESEFFAENLTIYIHSHDFMKTNHKKVFDFMENLIKFYGIQKDKTVNPHFIEAIQSGLAPEMFNKLYK